MMNGAHTTTTMQTKTGKVERNGAHRKMTVQRRATSRRMMKSTNKMKDEAKSTGVVISTKKQPKGSKLEFMPEGATVETIAPIPYDVVNDLKEVMRLLKFHIGIWLSGTDIET
ncbi:60S ribosomal L21-2 [Olea europaea subsp. europaea]|uniref:60S ribosomal L21-2 n=1 Tax=Olea europaea subsp. europaea TaxID=158383 RepID=A0A8S0S2R4_OLEEU|nr:60S ribosomal L21-2 [Olea europaea subsp. europaea]